MPEHFVPHSVAHVAGSMSHYLLQPRTTLDSVEIWGPLWLTSGTAICLLVPLATPEGGLGLVPVCPLPTACLQLLICGVCGWKLAGRQGRNHPL